MITSAIIPSAILIALLGCNSFPVREAASACLSRPAWLPLARALESHPDCEIRQRAWAVVDAHLLRLARAGRLYPTGWNRHPWIYPGADYLWAAKEWSEYPDGAPDWTLWRHATELLLKDEAAHGVSGHDLQCYTDWLARREIEWRERNNMLARGHR